MAQDEYQRALEALLGSMAAAAHALPESPPVFAGLSSPNSALAEAVLVNAIKLSELWVQSSALPAALPCANTGPTSDCALEFINVFGRQALRRPLEDEERLIWLALFERESGKAGFEAGIQAVLRSLLLHPDFLLHLERGRSAANASERNLTPHELANRLAFLLRGAPADEALAKAADEGELNTSEQIEHHVLRLLSEAPARLSVQRFYQRWFRLDGTLAEDKDEKRYPFWTPAFAAQALEESLAFAERNFFEHEGNVGHLLTDPHAKLTPDLARLYGVSWREGWVELPRAERAGILTRSAFLSSTSGPVYSHLSYRGTVLLNDLLCLQMPLLPDNVDLPPPPEPDDGLTRRQRLEANTAGGACRTCHDMIDPIAYALSHYDAVGGFQTLEDGLRIDATGELHIHFDDTQIDGAWTNAIDMAKVMAAEPQVKTCMSRQLWQHLMGRPIDDVQDACMLERLQQSALSLNGNLRPLLINTLTDPLFRKFVSAPFPQPDANSQRALSLPDAPQPHHRAALQAAWQFRITSQSFPPSTRKLLNDWSQQFDDLARRLDLGALDAP